MQIEEMSLKVIVIEVEFRIKSFIELCVLFLECCMELLASCCVVWSFLSLFIMSNRTRDVLGGILHGTYLFHFVWDFCRFL